ncbi:hypothetical protein [Sorangium sp. So ce1335]|uniref:hypothetical protein n=1 Tax=Sorangium sp. So ce1335 TaxID=3133335 RepID=UPI003F63D707
MSTCTSLFAVALTGSLLAGCGDGATSPAANPVADRVAGAAAACLPGETSARAEMKVYTFFGAAGAQSRVERRIRPDGSETLSSETRRSRAEAGGGPAAAGALRPGGVLREYAELDAAGRLVYADVSLSDAAGVVKRMILDPQHGAALLRRAGQAPGFVRIPTGGATIYAPVGSMVTPVAAWVARRAAQAAPSARLFDDVTAESHEILGDQLVVEDGRDTFVVLGDAALSVDEEFITSLPLGDAAMETACEEGGSVAAARWRSG